MRSELRPYPNRLSWLLLGLAGTAPFLYPLWLAIKGRAGNGPENPSPDRWPGLSVIVPAYLERQVIAGKVADIRGQGYPGEIQLTVVAEDPETAAAARAAGAEVIAPEGRLGKAGALNLAVEAASHPVVVITDANAQLAPGSLAALARWFQDPSVGAVAGEKRETTGGQGLYWRFESWLKRQESRDGGTVGLVGELAAIRRSLYRPIPPDVAVDDLWIALDVIGQQRTITYEPEALALEEPSPTIAAEWERRTRTTTGVIDVLARRWTMLVPGNPAAGKLWGHKLMRSLIGPLAHAALLAQALLHARRSALARIFSGAHLLGAITVISERQGLGLPRPVRMLGQFLFLQATALGGIVRYGRGDRPGIWPKTERSAGSDGVFDQPSGPTQHPQ